MIEEDAVVIERKPYQEDAVKSEARGSAQANRGQKIPTNRKQEKI